MDLGSMYQSLTNKATENPVKGLKYVVSTQNIQTRGHGNIKLKFTFFSKYYMYTVTFEYVTYKVSLLGVDSLWGDCTFIPADWGS